MENRIKKVMSEVLGIDEAEINENTSPEIIESWDSLKQMNLIVAFEEEFEIELSDDDIENLLNFKLICITINEYMN